jgi:GTPase SAR1 family protein
MERVKRILVLGDSQIGKSSFLESLFEKNNYLDV